MDNNLIILSILIAGPIILFLLIQLTSKRKLNRSTLRKQWSGVRSLLSGDQPQFAVIEADKVFDSALKQLGFKGDTMGDRLKNADPSMGNSNAVWSAHKLRNKLVHETDVKVSKTEAQAAIASFEKALKKMGAL